MSEELSTTCPYCTTNQCTRCAKDGHKDVTVICTGRTCHQFVCRCCGKTWSITEKFAETE